MQRTAVFAALAIFASAWTMDACLPASPSTVESAAHDAYLAAINSNDIETFLADLTDEVVYQATNEPEIVGKDAVRSWAARYLGAYHTEWKKTAIGFTVAGAWAFERHRSGQGHQHFPPWQGWKMACGGRWVEF